MSKAKGKSIIRVLLVDDHEMVRMGLAMFISTCDDIVLVGEAANGEEAVKLCRKTKPHVVLMDLIMPGMNGIEATREIMQKFPATKVIALTSFRDEEMVQPVLAAGAISYLYKDVPVQELAKAIREASVGKSTLAPDATQALISAVTRTRKTAASDLTARELDVLRLVVKGYKNGDISKTLGISLSTVKTHVSSILAKLGVHSRVEAVSFAIKQKLFD